MTSTSRSEPEPETVRWGIVGTGDVSRQIALDFHLAHGAEPRAIASRSSERAGLFAKEFDIPAAFGEIDELLDRPDIDAIYIATPHATHRDIAVRALEAGKHVLVEKPIGIDDEEARRIEDAAERADRFAMEAMWMKFNPAYRQLVDELRADVIGHVMSVRASFGAPFPRDRGSRWSAELHGSTLLDQGIYPVTLAMEVLGSPDSITASGEVRADGVDLRQHVTFDYDDGRWAQLAASMTEWVDPTASISGDAGWINIPFPFWAGTSYTVHAGTGLFESRAVSLPQRGNGYTPMIEAASEAISNGLRQHALHTWADVHRVYSVLDHIRSQLAA